MLKKVLFFYVFMILSQTNSLFLRLIKWKICWYSTFASHVLAGISFASSISLGYKVERILIHDFAPC